MSDEGFQHGGRGCDGSVAGQVLWRRFELQAAGAVGDPLERKKRAVRRADHILDILGEVRIALIDGDIPQATLANLQRAIREQRDQTDDPRLEGVLNEIETRAAVELAKLQVRGG